MSEIGDDVVVLRHPRALGNRRGGIAVLVLAPVLVSIIVFAVDVTANTPAPRWHMPVVAGLIVFGAYLVTSLIAMPGLLMIGRERLTEELHVGRLGLELRQSRPGGGDAEQMICWRVLWSDIAQAKLRYRSRDRRFEGVDIRTHSGMEHQLYVRDWEAAGGTVSADKVLRRAILPVDSDTLRRTSLVKALSAGGLQVDDDVPRPTDRLATWLGLGLGAAAVIAALIFNYIVER